MTRFRLGSLFGIDLFLHWSFFLLLSWAGYQGYAEGGRAGAVFVVLLVCAVFLCVVLHELGHSLAARKFGVPTLSITLYPIGGVARLGFIPRNPRQELFIAIAGPAVNFAIAAVLTPIVFLVGLPDWNGTGDPPYELSTFLMAITTCNVVMILFNLIPAFPMDGGRVLRSLIAWKGRYVLATTIAARLGQLMAFAFVVAGSGFIPGWDFRPTLMLIGGFIFFAAESERKAAKYYFFPDFSPQPPPIPPPVRTVIIGPDEWEVHPR